jgi:hypothetical protein
MPNLGKKWLWLVPLMAFLVYLPDIRWWVQFSLRGWWEHLTGSAPPF